MSKKIDYLTTDPEIPGQRWVCLSFLTPELVKMDKNCNVRSVKVRGVYSSEEEAKKYYQTELMNNPKANRIVLAQGNVV